MVGACGAGFADPAHFTQLFQQPADGAPSTEAQLRREICSAFRLRGVVTVVAEQDMASLQPGHMLQRRAEAHLHHIGRGGIGGILRSPVHCHTHMQVAASAGRDSVEQDAGRGA